MIRALILPGLDGSAELRREFAAALAPEFAAEVLACPPTLAPGYDPLTDWVRARLPRDEPYVLIAESYSGPVAIRLAAMQPPGLVGIVLSTTFARSPRPGLRRLLWLLRLPMRRPPMWAVMRLLMGPWSTAQWRGRLQAALAAAGPVCLRERLRAAGAVDVLHLVPAIGCPLLYLRGKRDRIVGPDSWALIRDASRNAVCIEIDGPHMLLQARPEECAAAVKR